MTPSTKCTRKKAECLGSWEWGAMRKLLDTGYTFDGTLPEDDNAITYIYSDFSMDNGVPWDQPDS